MEGLCKSAGFGGRIKVKVYGYLLADKRYHTGKMRNSNPVRFGCFYEDTLFAYCIQTDGTETEYFKVDKKNNTLKYYDTLPETEQFQKAKEGWDSNKDFFELCHKYEEPYR